MNTAIPKQFYEYVDQDCEEYDGNLSAQIFARANKMSTQLLERIEPSVNPDCQANLSLSLGIPSSIISTTAILPMNLFQRTAGPNQR